MKPFWESADGRLLLYGGDCRVVLPKLGIELAACVTDPPYNVGLGYGAHDDNDPHYEDFSREWLALARAACAGPVVFTPGTRNLGMWYRIREPDGLLCWHKPAAMGRAATGFCNWEPVLVYGKLPNARDGVDVFRTGGDVFEAGIRPDKSLHWHPCAKPVRWGVELIERASKPWETVLDPFSGSGSVGCACVHTGRSFVGVEKDPDYLERSARRIEAEWKKLEAAGRLQYAPRGHRKAHRKAAFALRRRSEVG